MKKHKVYIVGGGKGYANWLEPTFVNRMEEASLVMLTGGSDVSPSLYGKHAHPTTSTNYDRDVEEVEEFKKAKEFGIPMLGICRGSQAICAFSGGLLVQDSDHPYIHKIMTNDNRMLTTNSTHHQRQAPFNLPTDKYEILAWAVDRDGVEGISPYSFGESDEDDMSGQKEVEICFYKDFSALAIQPHPEMLWPPREDWQKEFIDYCRELVEKYLE